MEGPRSPSAGTTVVPLVTVVTTQETPVGTRRIDLNSDLGEGFGPWSMGDDEAMMDIVSSVNIACGGHAGDPTTMARTVRSAADRGLAIGAHPGFADREGFGRRPIPMSGTEVERLVASQVGSLAGIAALEGAALAHVKAHGALANLGAREEGVADAIARAVRAVDGELVLLAIAGTALERAADRAGLAVAREGFADRAYADDGQLAPRSEPGAVLADAEEAAERAVAMAEGRGLPLVGGGWLEQEVDSVCVHGDTPGAVAMARRTRQALEAAGFEIATFAS